MLLSYDYIIKNLARPIANRSLVSSNGQVLVEVVREVAFKTFAIGDIKVPRGH